MKNISENISPKSFFYLDQLCEFDKNILGMPITKNQFNNLDISSHLVSNRKLNYSA